MSEMLSKMDVANVVFTSQRRPWLDAHGKSWIIVGEVNERLDPDKHPVKEAKLTKDQWQEMDAAFAGGFHQRLQLAKVLKGQTPLEFDGMAKMSIEMMRDDSTEVRPSYRLECLPLPIIYSDFCVPSEAKKEGRRLGDAVERLLLRGWRSGDCKVEGVMTHPKRFKFKLEPKLSLNDNVQQMAEMLKSNKFCDTWVLLRSAHPEVPLDAMRRNPPVKDFDGLLKEVRHMQLGRDELALVQVTPDVIRLVEGLQPVIVQVDGGFRAMVIMVPQIRTDSHDHVGIVTTEEQ